MTGGAREPTFVPSFLTGLPQAGAALAYAYERHHGQWRESDEAPFILHPLEVGSLLHNTGHSDAVVAAGILHDTVEDTPASLTEIRERFGAEVADLVAAMTEDASIQSFAQRKAALRGQIAAAGPHATSVFAADKVAKVRELRARLSADPSLLAHLPHERARLDHYRESLSLLEEVASGHPLVRQLRFELEALSALPPRAAVPRSSSD